MRGTNIAGCEQASYALIGTNRCYVVVQTSTHILLAVLDSTGPAQFTAFPGWQ